MGLIHALADVRVQDTRVTVARARLPSVVDSFNDRARKHPLIWLGAGFGAGYVLERLPLRPWRIPGLLALLSGEGMELLQHALDALGVNPGTDAPTP